MYVPRGALDKKILQPAAPRPEKEGKPAAEFDMTSAKGIFEKEMYEQLLARNFETIESVADTARKKKERMPGGYWKVDSIYDALQSFNAEYKGQKITAEMWENRIELLKQWKASMPESITARVALAQAYISYGWFARGTGYIDSVSKGDYEVFHQRLALSERELAEARKLKSRCPRWYREMLVIAMTSGWPREEFERLYDEGIEAEPNYLQQYLVKSESLTPKWNGKEGDWQNFVDSLPGKLSTVGATEPDIIYFVVVVNKLGAHSLGNNWAMVSKERIRRGFAEIERKYGSDNFRLNQYAYVSCVTMDLENARKAFQRIGNDRDNSVWGEQTFNVMKKLAVEGIPGKSN